jgi:hypothetical protein
MTDLSIGPIDLASFATLRQADIEGVTVLRETAAHVVCRITCAQKSYILKWLARPTDSLELRVYSLLHSFGVATLPVYETTPTGIILEDLESSSAWRLATPADMELAATGRTVADWYKSLHRVGFELARNSAFPDWLSPWVDLISASALEEAGAALGLQDAPAWKLAVAHAKALKARYLEFPQTLNYNDFAAENLALSRVDGDRLQAIVFDYDCFASGTVYSDWRNVTYSLHGAARESFIEAYGPIDEQEGRLDEPLAALHGLIVSGRRSKIPRWAAPLIEDVVNGNFAESLRRAGV